MPLNPKEFYDLLSDNGVNFFTGVPDSLLKEFCKYIDKDTKEGMHVIAANEGNAVAIAAGHYLSTGKMPLVYMQNSGLGNAVNPLLSLCDPEVYSIPILLLIGWRGEPGVKDEPQHVKQGKVQIDLLKSIGIPFEIISENTKDIGNIISDLCSKALEENRPVALLAKKNTFEKSNDRFSKSNDLTLRREDALQVILSKLTEDCIIVSTTGKTSREIFEIREKSGQPHYKDFLTIGSMGHCSSIALGIAISKSDLKVVCIDGDGALIMHMGSMSTIGKLKPENLKHILINNFMHESVGGQDTAASFIDFPGLAKMNGYSSVCSLDNHDQLSEQFSDFLESKGPSFMEIKVTHGSRDDLGRPTVQPQEIKNSFMDYLSK